MGENLEDILTEAVGIFNYRNCLVKTIEKGKSWEVFGHICRSVEEVDEKINEALKFLNKSIK